VSATSEHEAFMRLAMREAEKARGGTGDNPWVGCVIVDAQGTILGRGHTHGPGEDHAEIDAAREAQAEGRSIEGATLYSTLEPCAFHGRTPACAHAIVARKIARVVLALRDPHPRVDGAGVRILRDGGIDVIEAVLEDEVRRQLAPWILAQHPHEPRAWADSMGLSGAVRREALARRYGIEVP
jgi:diaminohydroxyphosphoribosylaminopyrimidine deaminase/5-amino-6-(5-phosphoribosylamino)uracil reductase